MSSRNGPVYIEYLTLTELAGMRWADNPKDHDVGLMHELYEAFGFVAPLGVNDANGELLWGHGRVKTALQRKAAGDPPPERVVVRDGDWCLPVVRGVSMDPEKGHRYAIADNRSSERGAWDDERLADVLSQIASDGELAETGFDGDDLDRLLQDLKPIDYSDYDAEVADNEGYIEVDIKITVPAMHEADVRAWLSNGNPMTAPGMGKGVLQRCGLL